MTKISIPGDPSGLSVLASKLEAASGHVESVQGRVGANGLDGSWTGKAAETFRGSLHEMPSELTKVGEAFADAGRSVASFASRLSELQEEARWRERQIEEAEQERDAAETRRASAQTQLEKAHLQHSLASDPVSLNTAKQAVELGESLLTRAVSDVEEKAGSLATLAAVSVSLREDYEAAVRGCCTALDAARHSGSHSFLTKLHQNVDKVMGRAQRDGAALLHVGEHALKDAEKDAERLGDGALKELDSHWSVVRGLLKFESEFLGDAALALAVLLPIMALIPVVGWAGDFIDVGLIGYLGVASASAEGLLAAGDYIEGRRGNKKDADAAPDEVYGTMLSFIPADKVFGPVAKRLIRNSEVSKLVERTADAKPVTGVEDRAVRFAEQHAASAKAISREVYVGVDNVEDKVKDAVGERLKRPIVKNIIGPVLDHPEVLEISLRTSGMAA